MSTWYALESVSILKSTVVPWFTLMLVANPWMPGSPAPETSHSLGGFPGSAFSVTIGLLASRGASATLGPAGLALGATVVLGSGVGSAALTGPHGTARAAAINALRPRSSRRLRAPG